MDNKIKRLQAIRNILGKDNIENQEHLLTKLKKKGFAYTQATLSRDLKLLKVSKIPDVSGKYRLVIQNNHEVLKKERPSTAMHIENIISIAFTGNLIVVKTLPGYAPTVALAFDNLEFFEILGSVAGDDTLYLAIKEETNRSYLINALLSKLPKLKELIVSK